MPADPSLPAFRSCLGGIGHVILPVLTSGAAGGVEEIGRLITEPLAMRTTEFSEAFAEAEKMRIHPDTLAAEARHIGTVDRQELELLARILELVLGRAAREDASRARNLALAEAFERVSLKANREVVNQLLTGLVLDFTEADAAMLATGSSPQNAVQFASFREDVRPSDRELVQAFNTEVVRWIAETGYPISFPDLGGSAWCRHVLRGERLEGSLAALPIKLPEQWLGWWTVYYQKPAPEMEDQLHRLSMLSAYTAQTLVFLTRLEASQEAALNDTLTGLHNRRFLDEQLSRELSRSIRGRYPVALLIFDVDDLKVINDRHGPVAGDEILKHVARVLGEPLRRSSLLCRFGGDEFGVLVPECGRQHAEAVARRLVERVAQQPLVLEEVGLLRLTISAGVATHYPDVPTQGDLYEVAHSQLLRSKREGKNRVSIA
jgi:diguanylate cyclase (GGDEF)-like protein